MMYLPHTHDDGRNRNMEKGAMDTRLPTGGVCPEVGHDCTRPRHMGPRHADKASDIEGWIADIQHARHYTRKGCKRHSP